MTNQPSPKFCWSCGAAANPGRFCGECGANLAEPLVVSQGHEPTVEVDPDSTVRPGIQGTPPSVDAVHPPETAGGRRRSPWLLLGGVAALLIVGIGVVAFLGNRGGTSPTVHGSLTLVGGGGYTTDTPCQGTSNSLIDNSDMRSTTPVKILDASGTIIGSSLLGPGAYEASGGGVTGSGSQCKFSFVIPLDAASTHYQVVIGGRTPYDFTDPNSLDLRLGGPPQ